MAFMLEIWKRDVLSCVECSEIFDKFEIKNNSFESDSLFIVFESPS